MDQQARKRCAAGEQDEANTEKRLKLDNSLIKLEPIMEEAGGENVAMVKREPGGKVTPPSNAALVGGPNTTTAAPFDNVLQSASTAPSPSIVTVATADIRPPAQPETEQQQRDDNGDKLQSASTAPSPSTVAVATVEIRPPAQPEQREDNGNTAPMSKAKKIKLRKKERKRMRNEMANAGQVLEVHQSVAVAMGLETVKPPANHCIICDVTFDNKKQIKRHMAAFHHRCALCQALFNSLPELLEHTRAVHNRGSAQPPHAGKHCKICDLTFARSGLLKKHSVALHYPCTMCFAVLGTEQEVAAHRSAVHAGLSGPMDTYCDLCDLTFYSRTHLRKHTVAEHHRCSDCAVVFRTMPELMDHVASRHGKTNPMMCKVCSRTFANLHDFDNHTKTAHCRCTVCPAVFTNRVMLFRHFRETHPKQPMMVCRVCGSEFISADAFESHLKRTRHNRVDQPSFPTPDRSVGPSGKHYRGGTSKEANQRY